MSTQHSKDPLHGVTLEALLNHLVARYGWAELALPSMSRRNLILKRITRGPTGRVKKATNYA